MAVNDLFKKVPVEIPNKSGFDESHEHLFTAKVGTLVPVMTDLLLPNDTVSLGVSAEIQLPPMATDFYGRVKAHFEQFFVPLRLCFGGWQELITHPVNGASWPAGTLDTGQKAQYLPTLRIPVSDMGPGSLSDYLGYGFSRPVTALSTDKIDVLNPLKYLAYHAIWDAFYRDSRIQQSAWRKPALANSGAGTQAYGGGLFATLPYLTQFNPSNAAPVVIENVPNSSGLTCADGVQAYELRQRNFGRDYFTNATTLPQAGQPAQVAFGISNNQGAFSIASLRAANSLQTWMERNNVAGYRYGDQIRAHFGIYPSDAALDRPLYLGRTVVDVYNKSIFQNDGNTTQSNTENPFSSVGAKYGSPLGVGDGSLCGNFTASEHGYLMTIFSLVPDSLYSNTLDKDFWYNNSASFPFPLLQGVGDEEISSAELLGHLAASGGSSAMSNLISMWQIPFGYTQRYSNHKFKLDRVSGLLKDGENLDSFALQRSFSGNIQSGVGISSQFIQIPTNFLDGVSAVSGDVSRYGCWVDAYFNYHKVSTLAAYSIPTLGDLKNTHTEVIPNGGVRL